MEARIRPLLARSLPSSLQRIRTLWVSLEQCVLRVQKLHINTSETTVRKSWTRTFAEVIERDLWSESLCCSYHCLYLVISLCCLISMHAILSYFNKSRDTKSITEMYMLKGIPVIFKRAMKA